VKFTGIDNNQNPTMVTAGSKEPLIMEDLFKLNEDLDEAEARPKLENGLEYYYVDDVE
jgi:hypothetical protein